MPGRWIAASYMMRAIRSETAARSSEFALPAAWPALAGPRGVTFPHQLEGQRVESGEGRRGTRHPSGNRALGLFRRAVWHGRCGHEFREQGHRPGVSVPHYTSVSANDCHGPHPVATEVRRGRPDQEHGLGPRPPPAPRHPPLHGQHRVRPGGPAGVEYPHVQRPQAPLAHHRPRPQSPHDPQGALDRHHPLRHRDSGGVRGGRQRRPCLRRPGLRLRPPLVPAPGQLPPPRRDHGGGERHHDSGASGVQRASLAALPGHPHAGHGGGVDVLGSVRGRSGAEPPLHAPRGPLQRPGGPPQLRALLLHRVQLGPHHHGRRGAQGRLRHRPRLLLDEPRPVPLGQRAGHRDEHGGRRVVLCGQVRREATQEGHGAAAPARHGVDGPAQQRGLAVRIGARLVRVGSGALRVVACRFVFLPRIQRPRVWQPLTCNTARRPRRHAAAAPDAAHSRSCIPTFKK